jgi:hypothetical protein
MNAGCAATLTFRFDGTGTLGGNCVGGVRLLATASQSVSEAGRAADVIVNRNGSTSGLASVN